jgi:hypothetical protein
MKKSLIYAWISFIGSYCFILLIDYFIRSKAGTINSDGISVAMLWSIWTPFILYSLYMLHASGKNINSMIYKTTFFLVNIVIAIALVFALGLIYTIETGIDAL